MPSTPVDPTNGRLPDGGPGYVETPPDLDQFDGWVAEPWNTATAALFVVIPMVWLWTLRGRYNQHRFLIACMPILAAGGIGGVLFHGLRRYHAFFLLDVTPIYVLGFTVAVRLWIRYGTKWHHLAGLIATLGVVQITAHFHLPTQWSINVSYAVLGAIVLTPIVTTLLRTRFFAAGWVYTALACFAIAWLCRIADTVRPPLLPMGTHWLWHCFGAATTASLIVYIFRLDCRPEPKPVNAE